MRSHLTSLTTDASSSTMRNGLATAVPGSGVTPVGSKVVGVAAAARGSSEDDDDDDDDDIFEDILEADDVDGGAGVDDVGDDDDVYGDDDFEEDDDDDDGAREESMLEAAAQEARLGLRPESVRYLGQCLPPGFAVHMAATAI